MAWVDLLSGKRKARRTASLLRAAEPDREAAKNSLTPIIRIPSFDDKPANFVWGFWHGSDC
jgi:hypothetical protein